VGERQVINYLNPTDAHGKDANIFFKALSGKPKTYFKLKSRRILPWD
jgi:hypothetical protein